MKNRNTISEELPYFSELRRVYIFPDGSEMTHEDYWAWRNRLKFETEEYIRRADCELKQKAIAATELINDLADGYAPSIAYSRASHKKKETEGTYNDSRLQWLQIQRTMVAG